MTTIALTPPDLSATPERGIAVTGKLDADVGLDLRHRVAEAAADGPVMILLDVSRVTHVTPSGLAGLIDLLRSVRSGGGDVRLYGSSPAIDQAHTAMRLGNVTRVYRTHRDAAHGLTAPVPHAQSSRLRRPAGFRAHFGRRLGLVRSS